jgi:hypothetical protein
VKAVNEAAAAAPSSFISDKANKVRTRDTNLRIREFIKQVDQQDTYEKKGQQERYTPGI